MQHIEHNNTPDGSMAEKISDSQSVQLSYTYAAIVNKLSDKYRLHPSKLIKGIDRLPEAAQTIFHADNIDVMADVIGSDTSSRYVSGKNIRTDTTQIGNILEKLGLNKKRMHIGDIMKGLSLNYPDSFKRIEEGNMKGRYIYNLDGLKEIITKISFVKDEVLKNTFLTINDVYREMYDEKMIDTEVNKSLYNPISYGLGDTFDVYNQEYGKKIFGYIKKKIKPVIGINPEYIKIAKKILKELLEKRHNEVEYQATRLEGTRGRFDGYKMSFNGPRFPPSKF